jgi:hypothetical protein
MHGVGVGAAERHHLGHLEVQLGQRAGLVGADDVDPGEALDGRQLLHQHVAATEAHDPRREGEAGQQHQALGDHRPDAGDGAADGGVQRRVRAQLAEDQQRGGGHDQPRDQAQDLVCTPPQLRPHQRELAGLGGELVGVALGPDLLRPVPALPGGDEAARQHLVARSLGQRHRLAGQQRLVDLEGVGGQHRAVSHDLRALPQLDRVVGHDVLDADVLPLAAPHDRDVGRGEQREPVERPLGPPLLVDADPRVGDEHHAEQCVLVRPDGEDHDQQRAEDGVEAGEDVGPHDLPQRPAGATRRAVDPPVRDSLGDVGRGQAGGEC